MGIKAIDYDDLKEGDLMTWYGMHVLRWEDDIRPLGIEPTIAFVQDDTLESENQRLRELLAEIYEKFGVSFDNEMLDRLAKELSGD